VVLEKCNNITTRNDITIRHPVYKATLEPETTQHNSQDRIQTRKLKSETLLIMSAATLKAIRLECYLPRLAQTCHLTSREDSVSPA